MALAAAKMTPTAASNAAALNMNPWVVFSHRISRARPESTAAVLLAGGAPGRRWMLPHGRVVLHQPAGQGRGTVPDLILEAEEIARVRSLLEEILAEHTGRTPQQLREDTDRDLILTGQQAVDYGIADAVLLAQPVRPSR